MPLVQQDAGDQESGQHEEDVDAEETAAEEGGTAVVDEDYGDRTSAHTVQGCAVADAVLTSAVCTAVDTTVDLWHSSTLGHQMPVNNTV